MSATAKATRTMAAVVDSPISGFIKDIETEFKAAEASLARSRFDLTSVGLFVHGLRKQVAKHGPRGCATKDMEIAVVKRANQTTKDCLNQKMSCNPYQTMVYMCCSLAAFPRAVWLVQGEGINVKWIFSCQKEGLELLSLVRRITAQPVDIDMDHADGPLIPGSYLRHLRQLVDVSLWLGRDVTNVAYLLLDEGFVQAQVVTFLTSNKSKRVQYSGKMTPATHFRATHDVSEILRTTHLINLGFMDYARRIYENSLRHIDRNSMNDNAIGKLDYVQAMLLSDSGKYDVALTKARRALTLLERSVEDQKEIEILIKRLTERLAEEEAIRKNTDPAVPDQEWIQDTNAHQTEIQAEKQGEVKKNHNKKSRHKRPHRRSPTPPERSCNTAPGSRGLPLRSSSLPRSDNLGSTIRSSPGDRGRTTTTRSSRRSSSMSGIKNPGGVNTVYGSAASGDNLLRCYLEDESDDDEESADEVLVKEIPYINMHDDYDAHDDEEDAVGPDSSSSVEEEGQNDWFEKSENDDAGYAVAEGEEEELALSADQVADLQRGGEGREFYPTLKEKQELLKLLKNDPERYKRCQLKIEWSHKSIAKVLDKGSKYSEILIDGRSKAGRCYMDDEVVVEILVEPGKSRGLHQAKGRAEGEDASVEKMAHGRVIGLLRRVTFADVEHPVLFCTLDENEGHLMRPLCKTVPKIHVMNDMVKRRYPALLKNRIEIKKIVNGRIEYKGFCNVRPEEREQYVFRVVLVSWRQRNIYPLGAVLGATIGGKDYDKGLKVLSMQQRVPKMYPRAVVEDTKILLRQPVSRANREDLTGKRIFTIDPPGSKDLDDAVSIDVKGNHYVIGVHIADVAAVVKKGSGVDQEARKRAVTFYPLDRKPHAMLPEPLCHGKCSLLPGEERQTFSVFFSFNKAGKQVNGPVVKRTIIKSCTQLTYEEVQKVIDKNTSRVSIEEAVQKDIVLMHTITSKLREKRQSKSMLFVPFEDPRLVDIDKTSDHMDAHSLIEELMILTNCFIARRLTRTHRYHDLMIVRSHKAPTFEELQQWQDKEGSVTNLVMQLQGRRITPDKKLSVDNFRSKAASPYQQNNIIVQRSVWEQLVHYLEDGEIDKARRLAFSDTLHPLQCLAAHRWMDLMETAQYKCSYGLNSPDLYHFGLDIDVYTHFTSPIRRYADLHVQRLLHADLEGRSADCTADEVTELCQHINSATARQKAFGKGCKSLKVAESLLKQSLLFRAYVDKVDTEQLTLCVPSLLSLSDRKQELTFSVLGVSSQPELVTDTALQRDKVTVQWKKRVYDVSGHCPARLASVWRHIDMQGARCPNPIVEMTLCPKQHSVTVRQSDWAKILRTLLAKDQNMTGNTPIPIGQDGVEVDYMTSEKGDKLVCLRPVRYLREYTEGQVLRLQMSALPSKGLLKPRVEMLQLARNVCLCTQHVDDPVRALTRHATRPTRDQNFSSFSDYRKAWMPLLEMEAAVRAGDSDGGVVIDNVKVTMTTQESPSGVLYKGVFTLPARFCHDRCIELGGKSADRIQQEEEMLSEHPFPLDYLCLRYKTTCSDKLMSRVKDSPRAGTVDKHYMWLAHASVVNVELKTKKKSESTRSEDILRMGTRSEDRGSLVVTFVLSPSSPQPPQPLMTKDGGSLTLEILPKSEVDRRAQEMLLQLNSNSCIELARAIAFGSKIPKIEKERKKLGLKDENHEVIIPDNKRLPPNNPPQLEAIKKAMTYSLTIIQGPPGSGKTNTGIKLVYLFCKVNREMRAAGKPMKTVVYCGPSNKSVDLVARELKFKLGPDFCPKIVRMYGSAIEDKDYPVPRGDLRSTRGLRDLKCDTDLQDIALHHIIRQPGKPFAKKIADFDTLFEKCIESPTRYSVSNKHLKDYRSLLFEASADELKHYEVVLCTCAVGGNMRLVKGTEGSVFQLIIDECAMSPEPHSMVPIVATQAQQVVLIGDHKQLRPIIKCQPAAELGLDQSLFERLYQKFPSYTVFLSTQYRMHPEICKFPSKEFYDDKLKTAPSSMWLGDLLRIWPKHPLVPDQPVPHVLVDVKGEEETLTVSTDEGNEKSKSNSLEAEKVIEILAYLKKWHRVDIGKVKVLTQYNAQRHLLEKRLMTVVEQNVDGVFEHYDKSKVKNIVSTVVSSQGGEWDYVILSTVRSMPSYMIEPNPTYGWCRQNLGFITDRNQVNVALTRARRGLIIVGNAELLRCDDVWRHLVERYEWLGCRYSGDPDDPIHFPPPPPRRPHKKRKQNNASDDWQQ